MSSPIDPSTGQIAAAPEPAAPAFRIAINQRDAGYIAVVDDDRGIAEAIADWLDFEGIAHHIFDSAEAMLAVLQNSDKGLHIAPTPTTPSRPLIGAIIDINLPGQNGLVLSENLRQLAPELPIVMISAMRQTDINKFGTLRADIPLLSKPFELDALENALLAL